MAKTTFKGLLRDAIEAVTASKVPIRAVEYDPSTKKLRVEFDREPAPAASAAPVAVSPVAAPLAERLQDADVKFIPGTRIPDDNTPIDALEIAAARPRYNLDPEPRTPDEQAA